jgi:hypothetical protein
MHPSTNQHHWLFETLRPTTLRKEFLIKNLFLLRIAICLIMRSNRKKMNRPLLGTEGQNFLVKVKLLRTVVLVEIIKVFDISRVTVGIGEGKLDQMVLVLEDKLEYHLQFACLSQYKGTFSFNSIPSRPLLLSPHFLPVHWPVAFRSLSLP